MIWHRCSLKLPSLFGPARCGREVTRTGYGKLGSVLSRRRNGCVSSANSNEPGRECDRVFTACIVRSGCALIASELED